MASSPVNETEKADPGKASNVVQDVIFYAKKFPSDYRRGDSHPAGSAVLLTNPHRPGLPLRTPRKDVDIMEQTLRRLDFAVAVKVMDSSLEKRQVKEMIAQISDLDLTEHSSFLFYYSGHGDESGLVLPDGHMIEYGDVISSACECKSLQGKPKIFLFDCSRTSLPVSSLRVASLSKEMTPPDCLVVFATQHHGRAFGDPERGSFFTTNLAECLSHYQLR